MSTHVYVCRCEHGAVLIATVDRPDRREHNADVIATAIRDGLTVERITFAEWTRIMDDFGKCGVCNTRSNQ